MIKEITNLSFKERDEFIRKIGISYKMAKNNVLNYDGVAEESERYLQKDEYNHYLQIKEKIDYILMQMEESYAKIIYNEFFSSRNSGWWAYFYSKSTFYRKKDRAMSIFLEWWNA